ncbi:MAG TPA: 3-keto-5-aminohexanoate cleavage protein, partial [Prolixibacteraceae bacterium]|nr:3-keto-5-aminohexanoate cleavage protein [Prolixibacteraceae bacterium]
MGMTDLIINFTPTGMVPMKSDTPYVPVHPQEIIEQVHEAFETGITLVHLHARDETGLPDYRKSVYSKIFEGIRKHC